MRVYRIHITSWTASFRYPNMISGYQPTLSAPPLSTLIGLISSAKGDFFVLDQEKIGFVFLYRDKTVDLETIYQMGQSNSQIKSNVIKREFLSDTNLFLYTDSIEIASYFRKPQFQLLLGRSNDLASVQEIYELDVIEKNELTNVKGTIIPFAKHKVAAPLQALPVSFTNTIPRRNIGTQPYFIVDFKSHVQIISLGFEDTIKEHNRWDVYWQEI
ncbi:MAG: type I-B CRISPR-associated protein Cas5 [Candidatus Atribacteria bacterium]|nr:type I-B CRISPR-associated protein Cas5 [Candidatus Atribacteria bacterium]